MSESWAGLDRVFDIIVQAVTAFWRSIYLFRKVRYKEIRTILSNGMVKAPLGWYT